MLACALILLPRMQIEMNQVSELKGLVDQLRGELTALNGENERLARRVAPEGDSASSLGASGIVEREGASLRATPPARASSRPGSRSRSRGSQSITPDEAQLLSAVVALEEENHWLQRCLAQVREEHPDRDYDGHAPALKTVGPGRWTEQRAQDRADKQEMKEIVEYVFLSATLYKLGGGRTGGQVDRRMGGRRLGGGLSGERDDTVGCGFCYCYGEKSIAAASLLARAGY